MATGIRQKKKPTRKQEQAVNLKAAQHFDEQMKAQFIILTSVQGAVERGFARFFGYEVPLVLKTLLLAAIEEAIQAAAAKGEGVDLAPLVDTVVDEFKAKQADEEAAAQSAFDAKADLDAIPGMDRFDEIFEGGADE